MVMLLGLGMWERGVQKPVTRIGQNASDAALNSQPTHPHPPTHPSSMLVNPMARNVRRETKYSAPIIFFRECQSHSKTRS